jgi:hypothetical protein
MELKQYFNLFLETFSNYWNEIKIAIYFLFVYLSLDIDVVKVLIWLMVSDTVLGSLKSIFVTKMRFNFNILLFGIVAKCAILSVPMILALAALGLGYDFKFLVEMVMKILIISETISAINNVLSIKDNNEILSTDYISKMLHAIRDFFKSYLDKILNYIKNN